MASRVITAVALAFAANHAMGMDDAVAMLQRGAETDEEIPTPRPRGHRIKLPQQQEVQANMKITVDGMTGESNRVLQEFIETDRRHYEQLRATELEDKAKHHAKEALRQQEQQEKRERLHAKKSKSGEEQVSRVEEEKKIREGEKVKRQEDYKVQMHRKEDEAEKVNHDEKEAQYEDHNAQRAAKTAERDALLRQRRKKKQIERQVLEDKKLAQEQWDADVMTGAVKVDMSGLH
mmetsp:Transcript_63734/g.143385  ORF Transcript_63734/g.143385 Transcript_63734/m.143385 type:complete len:234 (-) Transcript_63734:82-783(-)